MTNVILQAPTKEQKPDIRRLEAKKMTRQWIVYGSIAGILGDAAYFLAVAPVPLPDRLRTYIAFFFGPLLALAFVGLYQFFKLHKNSMALQGAALFGIIAGTLVNLMLVVQSAIFQTVPVAARPELGAAWDGINMVQLGMDISWDIYLSLATILLAVAMLNHPRFGRIWAGITFLLGAGLLVLNLAAFPIPPAETGSLDLGPFVGTWYLIIVIQLLRSLKWVDTQLAA